MRRWVERFEPACFFNISSDCFIVFQFVVLLWWGQLLDFSDDIALHYLLCLALLGAGIIDPLTLRGTIRLCQVLILLNNIFDTFEDRCLAERRWHLRCSLLRKCRLHILHDIYTLGVSFEMYELLVLLSQSGSSGKVCLGVLHRLRI
jgi:hypothetical protein